MGQPGPRYRLRDGENRCLSKTSLFPRPDRRVAGLHQWATTSKSAAIALVGQFLSHVLYGKFESRSGTRETPENTGVSSFRGSRVKLWVKDQCPLRCGS